jgi:glycosyltransferase involved in cell wall biosynthesis
VRILLVNKYNYLRSGTERYLFNLKRLLEAKGHVVAVFAMQHPRNQPATYDRLFVPYVDYRDLSIAGRLSAALRVVWYPQAARRMVQVLDEFQPDIVHLLNIYHQLSPSVLAPISRRGIPIAHTLNDYKLVCPNYLLYTQGAPCARCRNGNYFQAVRYRCLHDSRAWSLLAAVEMTLHKAWQIYERHVRTFIAPSAFAKATVEEFGVPVGQLLHIPYFLFPKDYAFSDVDGEYLVYIGRLSHEKGLTTLIRAMRQVPHAKLLIVGEGAMRPVLERMVREAEMSNVRFAGYLNGKALDDALVQARFSVLPSEWYEVFGQSIIESFIVGRPVVGARIGGIPELIGEVESGLLFTSGVEDELAACVRRLWDHPEETRQMGLNGRRRALMRHNSEDHYRQLFSLYERLVIG